jgi:hypothetical protein
MTKFIVADNKAKGEDAPTGAPKDFTTAIPMVDLGEAIKIVTAIRENGLETGSMDTVAKKLGYAAATSSPFYYRIRAARLFGLLSSKSSLSEKAKDYIKPHEEGMREAILADAIMGIPEYADLVKEHHGKKLNVELLGHWLEKKRNLTSACAATCAKAFEMSLRVAGMLSEDGSVGSTRTKPLPSKSKSEEPATVTAIDASKQKQSGQASADAQEQTMYLDKSKNREFKINGPVAITKAEYDRICKWLAVVMIVEEKKEDEPA